MAIDKIIPRFLVSDEDERLLDEGAMIDALNVSVSENGNNSEGVIKNMNGTVTSMSVAGSEIQKDNPVTVIGSVSDSQTGHVYYFVSDNDANSQDAIYRYKPSTNEHELVFKNSWLNFRSTDFVKADVLNAAFQQDGVVQTILYFTDNYNAPRKINVDRAIAGDYNNLVDDKLDHALKSIKSAPIDVPTFYFETDTSLEVNNFTNNTIQYAIQYIYVDGEESAISGYSALAYPEVTSIQGIESSGTGRQYYEDNICNIVTNWSSNTSSVRNIPDVSKIRILARYGNDGTFFIVDEFNPNEDLYRVILGTNTKVYDRFTGVYKFFNDGVYTPVSSVTEDKMYDNVPLLSQGQALAGNRLFYSNYVEGYENVNAEASITVKYTDIRDGGDNTTGSSVVQQYATNPQEGKILIDCADLMSDGGNIPSGTTTRISFEFDPNGSFSKMADSDGNVSDDWAIVVDAFDGNGEPFQIGFGGMTTGGTFDSFSGGVMLKPVSGGFFFEVVITNTEELTPAEFANLLLQSISGYNWTKTYDVNHTELPGRIISGSSSAYQTGNTFTFDNGTYFITTVWDLNNAGIVNSTGVLIAPRIVFASLNGIEESDGDFPGYTVTTQSFNSSLEYFINNDIDTDQTNYDNAAWHYSYDTGNPGFVTNSSVLSSAFFAQDTFKAGSTHDLGVVYYDKHNRSGFVNKLGSFYVEPFGSAARNGNNGAAYVDINFSSDAPEWAERYQIVYAGMNSFSAVTQYTTGGAYYNASNDNDRKVYVSLKTLEKYKDQKSALRDYSFTEGDKLRVISRDSSTGSTATPQNIVYPRANDGSVIEFNVVGVISMPQDGITFEASHSPSSVENPWEGDFLVLEAPAVAAGLETEVSGSPDTIKYPGFDWFSITGSTYPTETSAATQDNYWGQRCVVELLTPRKQTSEKIYYEVGESRRVGTPKGNLVDPNNHGLPFSLSCGDVVLTPISCVTPYRDDHNNEHVYGSDGNWNELKPDHWRNETIYLESQSISDFFPSKYWDKGRAHVVYDRAAQVRRFNGITYSDAYEEDVANLSLSSFNASLANFSSLDSKFGAARYIGNYNDDLVGLQENKLSLIPVNKNVIEYTSGSADVSISRDVLSQPRYSFGDYGCGNNPEAVLIQDNDVFFVDASRQAVMRLGGDQLYPISEKKTSSLFSSFFSSGGSKYISGYDPRDKIYFVSSNSETVGYDIGAGVWRSKYSFVPDNYSFIDNMMYSCKYVNGSEEDDEAYLFWRHDGNNRNNFYSVSYNSYVEVVSKINPSKVKVFNALSYEGSDNSWSATSIISSTNQQSSIPSFNAIESGYYNAIPRSNTGSSHKVGVGIASSASASSVVSDLDLGRLGVPINGYLYYINSSDQFVFASNDGTEASAKIDSVSYPSTINTSETINQDVVNRPLVILYNSNIDGDSIRGHWSRIKLSTSTASPTELYCINAHVVESKNNHSLGE